MKQTVTRTIATLAIAGAAIGGYIIGQGGQDSRPAPAKLPAPVISADFPYESKWVEVEGTKMHYVETGEGDPVLFIHGNPTSSYLWRNILPHVAPQARAIAVDLVGFGKSGKPDIDYTFEDQYRHMNAFIEALGLTNLTLVVHDWGSAVGLHYAHMHEGNIKGLAFMESQLPPALPAASVEAMGTGGDMSNIRDPEIAPKFLVEQNGFIEVIVPSLVVRELTKPEMDAYRAPFIEKASRKPILVLPLEIPIAGEPKFAWDAVGGYGQWLQETPIPKLHIYVSPGVINPPSLVAWLAARAPNYESVYVGQGLHYIQEDHPEAIGRALADWYRRIDRG